MSWQSYDLDRVAQKLVLKYRHLDVLNESHKMRMNTAYGLERFWGEHLRLKGETEGDYWKDVWDGLVNDILRPAQIYLPNDLINLEDPRNGESKPQKEAREARNSQKIENIGLVLDIISIARTVIRKKNILINYISDEMP